MISFDILIRSTGSNGDPGLANIDQFKPSPQDIERCRRWFFNKGITCYPTDFGLACSSSIELFESTFSTQVLPVGPNLGQPAWKCTHDPKIPLEIANYIKQVSISVPPEYF